MWLVISVDQVPILSLKSTLMAVSNQLESRQGSWHPSLPLLNILVFQIKYLGKGPAFEQFPSPESIRGTLKKETTAKVTMASKPTIDPDVLAALPPDIREEVLGSLTFSPAGHSGPSTSPSAKKVWNQRIRQDTRRDGGRGGVHYWPNQLIIPYKPMLKQKLLYLISLYIFSSSCYYS